MFEYKCKRCGETITCKDRLEDGAPLEVWWHDDQGPCIPGECGPLKRVWGTGFMIKTTDWSH